MFVIHAVNDAYGTETFVTAHENLAALIKIWNKYDSRFCSSGILRYLENGVVIKNVPYLTPKKTTLNDVLNRL